MSGEERMPPQVEDAEKAVLSAMMIDRRAIERARDILKDGDFYHRSHQFIFDAIVSLYDHAKPVDQITLAEELRSRNHLEPAGGVVTLASLATHEASWANIRHHAEIVHGKAMLRRVIEMSTKVTSRAYQDAVDPREIIAEAHDALLSLEMDHIAGGLVKIEALIGEAMEAIEQAAKSKGGTTGITTGIRALNKLTGGWQAGDVILIGARPSVGKAQPIDSLVWTKSGSLPIGSIVVGDEVAGEDGMFHVVTGVYPQGSTAIYTVTTDSGAQCSCCADHHWFTTSRSERKYGRGGSVKSTHEIMSSLTSISGGFRYNHILPMTAAVAYPELELPIDPYALGVFLGDGCYIGGCVMIYNSEPDVVARFARTLTDTDVLRQMRSTKHSAGYRVVRRKHDNTRSGFANELDRLGLSGMRAYQKHIPANYLISSIPQRVALLCGIMDTDGFVSDRGGHLEYSTSSEQLSVGLSTLVRSLGGRCSTKKRDTHYAKNNIRTPVRPSYRMTISFTGDIIPVSSLKHLRKWKGIARKTGQRIVSVVPSGEADCVCISVDNNTGLYLTNDYIPTHNSSLALDTIRAALKAGKKVGLFSLEMSSNQVIQRLICQDMGLNLLQVRTGDLDDTDWTRLTNGCGAWYNKSLWIDERSGVSPAEIRSQCHRVQREHGLDLVVIDYLQLMAPAKRSDSREQEVSSISRAIKGLAKEMHIPVIALSQLNRALEGRTDKTPKLSDLRECVSAGTEILRGDGVWTKVERISPGDVVASVSAQKSTLSVVKNVWSTGTQPCVTLVLNSGRCLTAATTHRVLTQHGWKTIGELLPESDLVATSLRPPPNPEHREPTPSELRRARLLGYMVANGTYCVHRSVGLCMGEYDTFFDASAIVTSEFPGVGVRYKKTSPNFVDADFSSVRANGWGRPYGNPLREWLRDLGIFGQKTWEKTVPDWVFQLGPVGAAEFIAGFLASDGCVKWCKGRCMVHFDTTSNRLAIQLQRLLYSVGIVSSIGRMALHKKSKHSICRISVMSANGNLLRLRDRVPVVGKRRAALDLVIQRSTVSGSDNSFGMPLNISRMANLAGGKREQGKRMKRHICSSIASTTHNAILSEWANSDLLWETVSAITLAGDMPTYDLEIDQTHVFIAEGVVTHNSGSLEQDADVIMFLHRPEMYGQEQVDIEGQTVSSAGMVQVLLAKQRNGPQGMTWLRFEEQFTRFVEVDMYRVGAPPDYRTHDNE